MPAQHDDALCLRQWDWSETSQTAAVFSRSLGLLRVLAKGSKRPKAPYSGGLEMLTLGRIGVIMRPNSELALLTEWDLLRTFPALRANYAAHTAGLYVADLLMHLIRDHDPHPLLFDAAIECLSTLDATAGPGFALLRFQWRTLVESGVRPVLDADARTGEALRPLGPGGWRNFSPELGGVIEQPESGGAGTGAAEGPNGSESASGTWRVRPSTLDLLVAIDRGLAPAPEHIDAETTDRANRLLASYLCHLLGGAPPTMSVVFPSGLSR